ncbi:MAG: hypothetical protein JNM51_10565 [Bacteroidia bacterium]|nr:hypothetical protein [Bacteroidia bacterium]
MKIRLINLIIISLLFTSCKKDITLDNLNGDKIGCFGHAGMGTRSLYPTNTLQSLVSCLNRGADGTEMDIQVTKDGVLVIFHNDDLSGVTGCGGIIRDLNWNEINACRVNSFLFKNLNIISFNEFIQNTKNPYQYIFTFDCKLTSGVGNNDEYYFRFASAIANTIEHYGFQDNVFIENSDPEFLNLIKSMNNNLKLFLLGQNFETDIITATENGFYGLSMPNNLVSATQIKEAHDKNIRVTIYGVETNKQNYDAIEKQADFIQTDNLDYVLKLFGKFNRKTRRLSELINNIDLKQSN